MSNRKQVSNSTSRRHHNALAQLQTSFTNANQYYRDFKLDRMIYYGQHGGDKDDQNRDLITDYDLIRDKIKFVEDDHDDDDYPISPSTRGNIQSSKSQLQSEDYEKKALKKYNDMLYKEYCLTDVQLYIQNGGQKQIPLRWRVKDEVKSGKGERICGNISCDSTAGLSTYEVPFQYRDKTSSTLATTNDPSSVSSSNTQKSDMKLVLVKLRVCSSCAFVLFKKSYRNPDKDIGSEVNTDGDRNIKRQTDHNCETAGEAQRSSDRCSNQYQQVQQREQDKRSDDSKVAERNIEQNVVNRKRPASSSVRQKQYDDFLARKLKRLQ
ncbi:hypothetical protein MP228_002146 [Amoeboaphelidium protococcarum]|nr:hypothetical protein MP228_002146 [Amoeboaphelidium protococcarum]